VIYYCTADASTGRMCGEEMRLRETLDNPSTDVYECPKCHSTIHVRRGMVVKQTIPSEEK